MEESESNDSSSEEMQLRIAESPKKKRKRKARQQMSLDFDKLDKTIEDTIAKCKNLTSESAKKVLFKLVKNDHVLALSLLKAEEENEREKENFSNESSSEDDKKSENEPELTPKLTRSKAKELNKQLPIPGSLNTIEPNEEVIKLIKEDLKSDESEEDDEYRPESDGEITNTTFSDIDSQPSTPGSALVNNDDSPSKNSEFKVPKVPLSAEEQENIARRTRSKLCLQTTSIETIEQTFVPPDIDLDMYDFEMYENEDDCEWKEFLNEFMLPLPKQSEEVDDDADPEYVATEAVPDDKEEKKLGRVSKKELNQLISELIEDSCNATVDSIESLLPKKTYDQPSTSKNSRKLSKTPLKRCQSSKVSTKAEIINDLNTPPHIEDPVESKSIDNVQNTPIQVSKNQYYYSPTNVNMQTPQRPPPTGFVTPTSSQSPILPLSAKLPYSFAPQSSIQSTPVAAALIQPQTGPVIPPPVIAPIQQPIVPIQQTPPIALIDCSPMKPLPSILVVNQNQLEVRPLADSSGGFNSSSIISQGFYYNGIYTLPQFQSVVVQVPTIDILQNGLNLSTSFNSSFNISFDDSKNNIEADNLTDDVKNKMKRESRLNVFECLKAEEPKEISIDPNLKGFTTDQRIIFEQQFRMHAQLLSQNYLQVYAHPNWWNSAEPLKGNLIELKKVCPKSIENHIENCLKLCQDWEDELAENNERNKKYMKFLHEEIELDEKCFQEKKHFKGIIHNRLFEIMLRSKAIIYPTLLPKTPFRAVKFTKVPPIPSELSMIALGIEHAYEKIYKELNSLNPRRLREPKIMSIVNTILRMFGSFRSENGLLKIIEKYKQHQLMNPIKYYYIHKRAPAVNHKIEDVDIENIRPPLELRRGALPKIWEDYKFSVYKLVFTSNNNEESSHVEVNTSEVQNIDKINSTHQEVTENLLTPQKVILNDSIQLEITDDIEPKINITILPQEDNKLEEEVKKINLLENTQKRSPSLKSWQKTNEQKQQNLTSILKKVTNNIEKSPTKKKSVNFLLPKDQPNEIKSIKFSDKIKASFSAKKKFHHIIKEFFSKYSSHVTKTTQKNEFHPLIRKLFIRTRSFDIYWQIVSCNIMLSKKNNNNKTENGTTSSENNSKTKKQISSEEYSKKINRKLADNRALIMQNAKDYDTVEKDCSYAYNYLQKVRKTLLENGDDELYSQFMKMLTAFNPETESVPELYYKMETLLMPNYSDLLDLFLTFLLPEHAAEIGKFCEHFMLTNMTDLVEKLNLFFQKQPHLKKVYACINELSNEQDLTLERLKSKILPLLKGNQVLIDWFMELFDHPTESGLDEYETLHLKKSLNDSEVTDDGYEEIQSQDLIENENCTFSSCGVKYINGKIMYRCKALLPAKISFLANDMIMDEKNNYDDLSSSFCVHEIRKHIQYNDSKKPCNDQDEKAKKKKISKKKFKVCETQILHAHAIRLNQIHAQNGEKLSDVMNVLESSCKNGSNESPRKQLCKSAKRNGNSPKKILKSPSSSSSDVSMSFSSPSPSKTLQISRKLKAFTTDSEDEQNVKKVKIMDSSSDSEKLHSSNGMDEDEIMTPTSSKSLEEDSKKSSDVEMLAWTREEDKLILEEIKNGFSNADDLIKILCEKLDSRSDFQIRERFEFLLNFVTNLTSS
ncbi:uncharacterized protein mute [Chironomus tepperi]|uniref:uncharacterized protein mute n=1 Tax=Chironomus tepperi TaxID=113505 RepID=UPI00391F1158